jgi:hypothetical protein
MELGKSGGGCVNLCPVIGSCEYDNELSDSIKDEERNA